MSTLSVSLSLRSKHTVYLIFINSAKSFYSSNKRLFYMYLYWWRKGRFGTKFT